MLLMLFREASNGIHCLYRSQKHSNLICMAEEVKHAAFRGHRNARFLARPVLHVKPVVSVRIASRSAEP